MKSSYDKQQQRLDGNFQDSIKMLEDKRKLLYDDMLQKIQQRNIFVKSCINKYRYDIRLIDEELHKLDGRKI